MEKSVVIKQELAVYIALIDMLAITFGEDCEIVLHDLSQPEHSVVYVANGHVTGREIGQSFDELVRQFPLRAKPEDDYVANYYFHKNGKVIRSSTFYIRDNEGKMIGAICINIDTTKATQCISYLQSLMVRPPAVSSPKIKPERLEDFVVSMIDNILANCDTEILTREERIKKIRFMDEKGIFQMKGSVEIVAEKLGVMKATVYSYLDEVRGKR